MISETTVALPPQPGQMVIIRQRPAVARDVIAYPLQAGPNQEILHAVEVEYLDGWEFPASDRIFWEREPGARVLREETLPRVDRHQPDLPERVDAFLSANRWEAINRLTPQRATESDEIRLIAPWRGAIQVEDYQLYPVLKALLMPRITMLLADDVGLGKTVEAGLILTELIARRRIRRALIICPAALQHQWREEMRQKFALDFTIIDRESTFRLRREQGLDTNPWAASPRVITSMDYLRQDPILQEFQGASDRIGRDLKTSLPWQLLIVDEAHNLAPARYGDDSQRCAMLRQIAPRCEHRLFLSATPHNGFTLSFSGLLEVLDPVHFRQTTKLSESSHAALRQTMVRRLKSALNVPGEAPRFAMREVATLEVTFGPAEAQLFAAVRAYRLALAGRAGTGQTRRVAEFIVAILTKRLLSSSYAFARTWWQHVAPHGQVVEAAALDATLDRAATDIADDAERQQRDADVVRMAGTWLQRQGTALVEERAAVDAALDALGWSRARIAALDGVEELTGDPPPDTRWEALAAWIATSLRQGKTWRADERAVIFTEYKDTLDYLRWRMQRLGWVAPVVAAIFGGAESATREAVKTDFADPTAAVRILLGTDAVSEGINLQASCRYVVHADIPWNPMRLEQRNGRVDRHGQARTVTCWHFSSAEEADLRFLGHVARKLHEVRQDLGSVGVVIDSTVLEHFIQPGGPDEKTIDAIVAPSAETRQASERDLAGRDGGGPAESARALQRLRATERALGLTPQALANVLRVAAQIEGGGLNERETGLFDLQPPPGWKAVVREALVIASGRQAGARPKITFDPAWFQEQINGITVYRPRADVALLRLGHPVMRRAMGILRRQLWEDGSADRQLARWTIRAAPLDVGLNHVLLLHVAIEAINPLREVLHQEILTLPFQALGGQLLPLNPDLWEAIRHGVAAPLAGAALTAAVAWVRDQWEQHQAALRGALAGVQQQWRGDLETRARTRLIEERRLTALEYDARLTELEAARRPDQLDRLRREVMAQAAALRQRPRLFPEIQRELEHEQHDRAWELATQQLTALADLIREERARLLETILPNRYALAPGAPTAQPLAIEYWVRG